ncbi:MAG: peptide MFS transporter [Gemmataceae bacterium]|nr:peptide MFS transporter [Gemmataceae bacterium]
MGTRSDSAGTGRTIFGHPIGLYVLFFTQMWERFSYFGMQGLLMYYMLNYFKWPQDRASSVYKWYTSIIFFTPLIGGYLADRYLGNRKAILIGAVLMAVGHFLMAFEAVAIFYAALIVLVIGCGLLTAPINTQVGLLYPPNDPRRDGAYTIYYMGINLGAFASPLLCGWLADHTRGGYHSGFTVAGIGMVIALLTYVAGMRWVRELDQTTPTAAEAMIANPHSEETLAHSPSVAPLLTRLAPSGLAILGGVIGLGALLLFALSAIGLDGLIVWSLSAVCLLFFAWITAQVQGGVRDRVLAIILMGLFVVFYWAGAGQGGNAMAVWAEKNTDRHLSSAATQPDLFPKPTEEDVPAETMESSVFDRWINLFKPLPAKPEIDQPELESSWWHSLWNPVPPAWFQSINPLLILVLAPFFAALWTCLERRGLNPSIPLKMVLGILFMAGAFALMLGAADREGRVSSVQFQGPMPDGVMLNAQGQLCDEDEKTKALKPFDAGRLRYDSTARSLAVTGVLMDLERGRIVSGTAPEAFVKKIKELNEKAIAAKEATPDRFEAKIVLDVTPPGFDLRYAGMSKQTIDYDPMTRTLTITKVLEEQHELGLKVAAGDPTLRSALNELMVKSSTYRVSSWWLFGFFLLATLGEFCLSPIGLSMVSKLAPAKFASMLMGLWLLTFSFGNLAAGWFGENWGQMPPAMYFLYLMGALTGAAFVLFVLRRKIGAMMHGVS